MCIRELLNRDEHRGFVSVTEFLTKTANVYFYLYRALERNIMKGSDIWVIYINQRRGHALDA